MRFLLLFAAWATLAFVPAWFISNPYQHALAAVAGQLVAPGREIEILDLQIYYPFDIGIYVALCLASTWVARERRLKAVAVGVPLLALVELFSLVVAMKAINAVMMNPHALASAAEEAERFATGIIRVTGLIAAAGVWFYFLGRERLSLVAKTWLGS